MYNIRSHKHYVAQQVKVRSTWLVAVAVSPDVAHGVASCGGDVIGGIVDDGADGGKPHGEVDDEHDHAPHQSQDVVDDGEDVAAERVRATVFGTGVLTRAVVVYCLFVGGRVIKIQELFCLVFVSM